MTSVNRQRYASSEPGIGSNIAALAAWTVKERMKYLRTDHELHNYQGRGHLDFRQHSCHLQTELDDN